MHAQKTLGCKMRHFTQIGNLRCFRAGVACMHAYARHISAGLCRAHGFGRYVQHICTARHAADSSWAFLERSWKDLLSRTGRKDAYDVVSTGLGSEKLRAYQASHSPFFHSCCCSSACRCLSACLPRIIVLLEPSQAFKALQTIPLREHAMRR